MAEPLRSISDKREAIPYFFNVSTPQHLLLVESERTRRMLVLDTPAVPLIAVAPKQRLSIGAEAVTLPKCDIFEYGRHSGKVLVGKGKLALDKAAPD